ncbi:MAG: polysaccharide biosynthesis tyrosine autokinase [Microscillaceae bacterium]|nr:polysaccharide biosynthesis tyrosine autokinase [Microscillaceae bacterium]
MSKIIENDSINLGLLFFKIRKNWWLFMLAVPLFISLAYLYSRSLERVYRYKSSILLSPKKSGAPRIDVILDISELERKVNTDDEIGVITSYDMIRKTINELDFGISYHTGTEYGKNEHYGRFPFKVTIDSTRLQMTDVPIFVNILSDKTYELIVDDEKIMLYDLQKDEILRNRVPKAKIRKKMKFGEWYRDDYLSVKLDLEDSPKVFDGEKMFFVINNMNALVKSHQSKLKVEPSKRDSYLLVIRMEGVNMDKHTKFLNKLMEVVARENLHIKNREGEQALAFIEKQLHAAEDSLYTAEVNYKAYQSETGILNVDYRDAMTTDNLDQLYENKTDLELRLNSYQSIYNDVVSNPNGLTVAPGSYNVNDLTINNYLNTLNDLTLKKAQNINLNENSPQMIQLNEQLRTTQSALKSYLKKNIETSQRTLNSINTRIADNKSLQTNLPIEDKRMNELARKFEYYKKTYEDLLNKRFQARIGLETNVSDVRIVEEAKKEQDAPVKPNTKLIYLVSLILGFGLPLGYIILMDLINNTIQNKQDIRTHTKIPFLGMIADGGNKNKLLGLDRPKSLAAESFRSLRINLDNTFENSTDARIIGITSTIDKEGKTYCSVNLSLNYALHGKKTILVATDLFKNQLNDYFTTISKDKGLSSYLQGDVDMYAIIQQTQLDNLQVITCGDIPQSPSQLINNQKIGELFEHLKQEYERIILDIPPIGYVSDYYSLQKFLDATLYLVKYNYSDKRFFDEINEQYENERVHHIYIVLNHVKFSSMYEFEFKNRKHHYYQGA